MDRVGVDLHPNQLRTPLKHVRVPITFYRKPTCPDWQLAPESFELDTVPARRATTIFDLDWRPTLSEWPEDYPVLAAEGGTVAGALVAGQLACSEAMPRLEELEAAPA